VFKNAHRFFSRCAIRSIDCPYIHPIASFFSFFSSPVATSVVYDRSLWIVVVVEHDVLDGWGYAVRAYRDRGSEQSITVYKYSKVKTKHYSKTKISTKNVHGVTHASPSRSPENFRPYAP